MARRIDTALAEAGLPPLQRSAWVEVDIDVLTGNASALRERAAPAALAAVVKADGYGHGLEMTARCAVAAGAQWLCVADAGEAIRLRGDGYDGKALVLYPVPMAMLPEMARVGVDVSVSAVDEARVMAELGLGAQSLAVHLEIDTGMTRGGVAPGDAGAAAAILAGGASTSLAGVWTHLSSPEDPASTTTQLRRLDTAVDDLAAAGIEPGVVHAAASGGLLAADTSGHALVRLGLALYGSHPGVGALLPPPVAPALAVKAHAVRIAEVPAGVGVGYSGTWRTARPSLIATIPIGYADGWSRSSSPGGWVLVEGERAPLVGRVSSDSLTVDVTDVTTVGPDSEFTLLGRDGGLQITADDVAGVRRTISWEVLQQLGARLCRVYTSGARPVAIRPESTIEVTTAPGAVIPGYG